MPIVVAFAGGECRKFNGVALHCTSPVRTIKVILRVVENRELLRDLSRTTLTLFSIAAQIVPNCAIAPILHNTE